VGTQAAQRMHTPAPPSLRFFDGQCDLAVLPTRFGRDRDFVDRYFATTYGDPFATCLSGVADHDVVWTWISEQLGAPQPCEAARLRSQIGNLGLFRRHAANVRAYERHRLGYRVEPSDFLILQTASSLVTETIGGARVARFGYRHVCSLDCQNQHAGTECQRLTARPSAATNAPNRAVKGSYNISAYPLTATLHLCNRAHARGRSQTGSYSFDALDHGRRGERLGTDRVRSAIEMVPVTVTAVFTTEPSARKRSRTASPGMRTLRLRLSCRNPLRREPGRRCILVCTISAAIADDRPLPFRGSASPAR